MTKSHRRSLLRSTARDAGFTLTEVVVVLGLLGAVLAMAFGAITSFQSAITKADFRSQSNDQARLAAKDIDRQVRSGNVLYDPSQESTNAGTNPDGSAIPAGFSMRIYTQANGLQRCVQWRIINTHELQHRSWSENWRADENISGWREAATNVINPAGSPPFSLDSSVAFGGLGPNPAPGAVNNSRLVNIRLIVNARASSGSNVEVTTSVEGRNTEYYSPGAGLCTDIPPP